MRTIIATIVKTLPALPWTPTSYVLNELVPVPKSPALPATVIPIEPLVKGRQGVLQNNWRLVLNADALFLDNRNDHLYRAARTHGLAIYAPLYDQSQDEDLFAAMTEVLKKPDDEDSWAKLPELTEKARVTREKMMHATLTAEVDLFGAAEPEVDLFGGESEEENLFG